MIDRMLASDLLLALALFCGVLDALCVIVKLPGYRFISRTLWGIFGMMLALAVLVAQAAIQESPNVDPNHDKFIFIVGMTYMFLATLLIGVRDHKNGNL